MRTMLTGLAALLIGAVLLGAAAPRANALDLGNLNSDERAQLRNEIRNYLLENPEVIMEAVAELEKKQANQQSGDDAALVKANADALFHDDISWAGGNPQGDITLVEFMDYRCGYCRRAFDDVNTLVKSDGNMRFVVKEFPILGEDSTRASRFAIATLQVAGKDAYKQVHETLMTYDGSFETPALGRIAGMLGIDAQPIIDHMDSDEVTAVIAANHKLAQRLQIRGTPTFVMNEQMLRGYLPLDGMRKVAQEVRSSK